MVNSRQIAHRARQRIRQEGEPRFNTSGDERDRLMGRFEEAVRAGDLEVLKATLADDMALYADGRGHVVTARRPLHGPDEVARFITGLSRKIRLFPATASERDRF